MPTGCVESAATPGRESPSTEILVHPLQPCDIHHADGLARGPHMFHQVAARANDARRQANFFLSRISRPKDFVGAGVDPADDDINIPAGTPPRPGGDHSRRTEYCPA